MSDNKLLQINENDDKTLVNAKLEISHENSDPSKTNESLPDLGTTETNSSSNSAIEKNVDVSHLQFNKTNMIIYYGRQFFCLLVVILTVYATYQNITPNHSKPPDVRAFFPSGSFVKDYPAGELFAVQTKVTLSDLSFVMFYAPWSAESQYARSSYEFVAKMFYKEASFSAINCWQPGGECKQQYTKVMSWPVLMAYNQNVAIPYNGQWTEAALTRFILSLIKPLQRINSPDDLLSLIHNHDAVVVSFLNLETSNSFYNIYLHTAIKWLERDPYRDVTFAVVTGDAMIAFGIDREPTVRLYIWNDTIEYDNTLWKPSLLQTWIGSNLKQVSYWLSPPGSKSTEFKPFVEKGPVLVLFTPRNLYETSNDGYAMLRQIGYEYFNCEHDEWLKEMSRNYISEQRKENYNDYHVKKMECDQLFDWKRATFEKCAPPFSKRTFVNLVNSSKFHYNSGDHGSDFVDDYCCTSNTCNKRENLPLDRKSKSCEINKNIPSKATTLLSSIKSQSIHDKLSPIVPKTSMLNNANDIRSPNNIAKIWKAINCKLNDLTKIIRSQLFYDTSSTESSFNASQLDFELINGLACSFNRTLSFLAMDSFTYELVAEKLGITLKNIEKNTAAVIIDSENESAYVLKESITTNSLINFIYDFKSNKLNRHLRNNANLTHSHHFNDENHDNAEYYHPELNENYQSFGGNKLATVSMNEVSSIDFIEYISNSNKTVAVLFYSTQCAFCGIFSSALLTVSRILIEINSLEFVRIDGDKNDLPWEFTMDTLPSLIIFNSEKKSESRKYPSSLQISLQNILGFILSNLNRPNRLHAMISILKYNTQTQRMTTFENGLNVLRREIEIDITYNLRIWRKTTQSRRVYILRRIQALKHLYLALYRIQNNNSDFNYLNQLVTNILNVWIKDEI